MVRNGTYRKIMKQILLPKNQFVIVDDEDYEYLNQWKWCLFNSYAGRSVKGRHVAMHRLIMNTPERMVCDHINSCKLDNRKSNLRNCTQSENCMNRRNKPKGAHYSPTEGKWRGQIVYRENGKKITKYLGYFATKEEALAAYDNVVGFYHKEYAVTNKEMAANV